MASKQTGPDRERESGHSPAGYQRSGIERDVDGTILHGPSLPCGCPLDAGCDGWHPGRQAEAG